MQGRKLCPALSAVLAALASTSLALTEQTVPTPPPSEYVDTESSVIGSLADWQNLGRKFKLTMSFNATPTNRVQIAFGRDINGDEDLEPEETDLVVGCDCGVWFVRDERPTTGWGDNSVVQEWVSSDSVPTPTTYTYTCVLRQPQVVAERWDVAKVTISGKDTPTPSITAEFNPGTHVILW